MIKNKATNWVLLMQALIVILAIQKSFWFGMLALAFCSYISTEIKLLEDTIKMLSTQEDEEEEKVKEPVTINSTCTNFFDYKGFTVENFGGKLFRVTAPNGNILDTLYTSLDKTKKDIDEMEPFVDKPVLERRTVHNIRFVR